MSTARREQTRKGEFKAYIQNQPCRLWENQLTLNRAQPLIPLELQKRKPIFDWFKNSSEFRTCYAGAVNYVLKPPSEVELEHIRQRFAGRVHQFIAYNILATKTQGEGNLLLGPLNTLIFYEALYFAGSTNKRIKQLFGDVGLNNTSLPDGLILEDDGEGIKIKEVTEYTLYGGPTNLNRRLRAFLIDQKRYPNIFSLTSLRFVVPLRFNYPKNKYYESLDTKVNFNEIPISHNQYRNFIGGIFYEYRGRPVLHEEEVKADQVNNTLIELLNWARARKLTRPYLYENNLHQSLSFRGTASIKY